MALSENLWGQQSGSRYLAPVEEYKRTVRELFPQIPKKPLDNCSIFAVDAIFLGYFLESLPRQASVVEIGSFVGTSAFCFASHPKVVEVTCIDPNLPIADEFTANSDIWKGRVDLEPLQKLKPRQVAREALSRFEAQREKISFLEGVAGVTKVGANLREMVRLEKVEVPVPSKNCIPLAYVDGLHTREGVLADLMAIFDSNPEAVVILDDCRHAWGLFVQAGIVDFMEDTNEEYRFRLVADLSPSLGTSNLGVLYSESRTRDVETALTAVTCTFGGRLDLLRLLRREEELIATINITNREIDQTPQNNRRLRERISRLEEHDGKRKERVARLEQRESDLREQVSRLKKRESKLQSELARYQSRRYKMADAAAKLLGR